MRQQRGPLAALDETASGEDAAHAPPFLLDHG